MKKLILGLTAAMLTILSGAFMVGCQSETTPTSSSVGESVCAHTNLNEVVTEPTCTTAGQKHVTCIDCGYVFEPETLDALGHDLGEAEVTEATCTSPKTYVAQCQREGCGEYIETTEGEALGHDYVKVADIAATCTDPQKAEYECNRDGCSAKKVEVVEGGQAALTHSYEKINETAATCTEAGGTTYKCTRVLGDTVCGDEYTDVVPALGHTDDGTKADVTDPTCVDKGYTLRHCDVCGEDYKTDFVSELGHNLEAGETVAASCSSVGYDPLVCSRQCGYVERTNVVNNTKHEFGEDGLCKTCGKDALNAFALVCEETTPFAILQNGAVYTVYSKSYSETTVKIPAEVLEALYKEGVYSFTYSLGSTEDKVTKSLSIKVQGGAVAYVNVSAKQLKYMGAYTFADENGVLETAKDGITFDVYYRSMDDPEELTGGYKVNSYAIRFDYVRQFDAEDSRTYLQTGVTYAYNADTEQFTLTDINTAGINDIAVRKEWLAYQKSLGYTSVSFKVAYVAGQHNTRQLELYSNGKKLGAAVSNGAVEINNVELTEELCKYDIDIDLYISDNYGTAWNPANPTDKVILTVAFTKPLTLETCLSPADKALSSVEYSEADGWTLTNKRAVGNGYTTIISGEYLLKQIEAGNVRLTMTFDMANSASVTWFELIVTTTANTGYNIIRTNNAAGIGSTDKNGNRYFDLDLTNETYDYSKGVKLVFNNAYMSVESIEFFDEERKIAKDEYMVPENTAVSSVAYNAETGVYAITKVDTTANGYNTKITTAVINEQIAKGMKVLRITFDKSVDGGTMPWVEISLVSNASGSDAWVKLYGNGATALATDKDGNKYCDIDLTNANYRWTNNAYGVRIVLTQVNAGVMLNFWEEIPEEYYFRAGGMKDGVPTTTVPYNAETELFTLTPNGACNVYMMPDVLAAKVAEGATAVRVTFVGKSSIPGNWLDVNVWNASGQVKLYSAGTGASNAPVDKDGNKYFEVDLTQELTLTTGYGIQIALNLSTAEQAIQVAVEFKYDKYSETNTSTWVKTEQAYTVDGTANTITVTGITSGNYNLILRKEWLQAGLAAGYNTVSFKLGTPSGQKSYFAVTAVSNGTALAAASAGNLGATTSAFTLADLINADLELRIVTSDLFSVTAWGATAELDSFIVTVGFGKVYVEGDPSTYLSATTPYTYDATTGTYTVKGVNAAGKNTLSVYKEALAAYLAEGYTNLDVTFASASGQGATKNLAAASNGTAVGTSNGNTNGSATVTSIALTEDLAAYNLDFTFYCYDHFGTAWNTAEATDRIVITLTFTKAEA